MAVTTVATLVVSEAVKASAKPLFDEFIKPSLSTITKWFEEKRLNKKVEAFESEFLEYCGRTFNMTEYINVQIFPNAQIKLEDFYEPLSIQTTDRKKTYEVDNTNLNFLIEFKKIIISDSAGMGKSTLMKWITRQCIKKYLGVPVLIELKKINPTNSLIQEIFSQFGSLGSELDTSFVIKLLSLGKFIIILDGYDEIAQAHLDFATKEIIYLLSKANENYYILTSRPDPILATFGSFRGFHIRNLETDQSNSIIRKCDKYSPLPIGEDLIADARMVKNTLGDFLHNPFLVTLLYSCYYYNKNIPVKKSEFYEELYNSLFKKHDLSKEKFERIKRSGLDSISFRQVLRKFAFNSAKKGINDFTDTTLVEAIKEAQSTVVGVPSFDSIHFAEDLVKSVPLMVREGLHTKWSHKSLQDFFAAESIRHDENKSQIIMSLFKSKSFYRNENLFAFIIEQDYALVRQHVLYSILVEFRNYIGHIKSINPSLHEDKINLLASCTFGCEFFASTKDAAESISTYIDAKSLATGEYSFSMLMHLRPSINNKKVFFYVSNNTVLEVISMINAKGMDDLIERVSYKQVSHKKAKKTVLLPLKIGATLENVTHNILSTGGNPDLLDDYLLLINEGHYSKSISVTKAMQVLRDIEQLKVAQEAENTVLF